MPRDYAQAAGWYRAAARAGDIGAQSLIAHMYEEGYGVPRDLRLARHWYGQAALGGDRSARIKFQALGAGVLNAAERQRAAQ